MYNSVVALAASGRCVGHRSAYVADDVLDIEIVNKFSQICLHWFRTVFEWRNFEVTLFGSLFYFGSAARGIGISANKRQSFMAFAARRLPMMPRESTAPQNALLFLSPGSETPQ